MAEPAGAAAPRIPIKVVVVAMNEHGAPTGDRPGELQYWVERLPLPITDPLPQGWKGQLHRNEDGVLAFATGVGTARSAASVMALGMDPRYDFSQAYWLVAGVAGVDPADAAVGSAVWAEWVVDGDLSHSIAESEMPADWPTGRIPLRRHEPYAQPLAEDNEGAVYQLNPGLVEWAFQLTRDTELPDTPDLKGRRALFDGYPAAQQPPHVMRGDSLSAMNFWHGEALNKWANAWVDYWTEGEGEFVTSAMEDTGTLQALSFLAQAGKVDRERVLVLRTASNYTTQWPGVTAAQSLKGENSGGFSAYIPALDAAYRAGSVVVDALVEGWSDYRDALPVVE